MLRSIASSIFRKANLPYLQEQNWVLLRQLNKRLKNIPRYMSGEVSVDGWDLEYIDALSLISTFDTVVLKGWNDFNYNGDSPIILDCGCQYWYCNIALQKAFSECHDYSF